MIGINCHLIVCILAVLICLRTKLTRSASKARIHLDGLPI